MPTSKLLIASIGQYAYLVGDGEVWVHLYAAGEVELDLGGKRLMLTQETQYPRDGKVKIVIEPESPARFAVMLRIPGWCRDARIEVDGTSSRAHAMADKGYVRVERLWKPGNELTLSLDMPVMLVRANPRARAVAGKVAVQHGPIVYCLEETDNWIAPLSRVILPKGARITAQYCPELLMGVSVLRGEVLVDSTPWNDTLYRWELPGKATRSVEPHSAVMVPYCTWDNREPGEMTVWMREA